MSLEVIQDRRFCTLWRSLNWSDYMWPKRQLNDISFLPNLSSTISSVFSYQIMFFSLTIFSFIWHYSGRSVIFSIFNRWSCWFFWRTLRWWFTGGTLDEFGTNIDWKINRAIVFVLLVVFVYEFLFFRTKLLIFDIGFFRKTSHAVFLPSVFWETN